MFQEIEEHWRDLLLPKFVLKGQTICKTWTLERFDDLLAASKPASEILNHPEPKWYSVHISFWDPNYIPYPGSVVASVTFFMYAITGPWNPVCQYSHYSLGNHVIVPCGLDQSHQLDHLIECVSTPPWQCLLQRHRSLHLKGLLGCLRHCTASYQYDNYMDLLSLLFSS